MGTDNLNAILNKLHAMKSAKIVTIKEIAEAIKEGPVQVSMWVMQRVRRPRADVAFKLQSFAAMMTLKISKRPQLAKKYRAAFAAANVMFPVEGSEK